MRELQWETLQECRRIQRLTLVTGQLTDKPTRRQPTRRQSNAPTNQLAEIEFVTEIDIRLFGHTDASFR